MSVEPSSPTAPPGFTLAASLGMELTFDQLYRTEQKLRAGSYGTVYTCTHRLHPETTYAVKILDRTKLKKHDDDAVFREVAVMKELASVPTVVRLVDFFVEPHKLYMVQVYARGGDVFDRLAKRSTYTEKDARDLAETLLNTIKALHEKNIVHRDLKPENLLLLNEQDDSAILLADFGFARHVPEDNLCRTRCGTPAYVAPEVILGTPYSLKCDLWSIGCLLYILIGGYPPFQGTNQRELFRKVRAADFVFHEAYWRNVSVAAKRLISSLLVTNPDVRWTAQQALQSDWFHREDVDSLRSTDLSSSLTELRKFRPRQTWISTIKAVQFATAAPFWNTDGTSGITNRLHNWDDDDDSVEEAKSVPHAPKRAKFHDSYNLTRKIRKGSYATVWECVSKDKNQVYAVKIIMRQGLDPKDDEAVLNEASMMQCLRNNRYVVELVDFFEETDYFYIVMEHMAGGDVFDRIVKMTRYTENDARDLVLVLLKAIHSMHKAGIAHRDVKPQNLLLSSADDHCDIKLGDFGFARRVHTPESLTSRCGTPSYVAPEILKNVPHDTRVDLWSTGVVAYILLVGYPPFMEDDQALLFTKIRHGDYQFIESDWAHISRNACDFIQHLLVVNPSERWTVEDCLRSEWIRHDPNDLSTHDLNSSLRLIGERKNRFRTIARAIMWPLSVGSKPTTDVATQAQTYVTDESTTDEDDGSSRNIV